MSSTVRIVNPNTYEFIQSIAGPFDRAKFPEDAPPTLIRDPRDRTVAIDGIKKDILTTYDPEEQKWKACTTTETLSGRHIRQQMIEELPEEMVGDIAAQAHNFSEWAVILGLTDPEIAQQPAAMDASAKELLSRLGIERNHLSAREQLLTVVFEEAFKSYSLDERLQLIEKMGRCNINIDKNGFPPNFQLSLSFKRRLIIFKIQVFVARIFGNPWVNLGISTITAWQIAKIYSVANAFYDRYAAAYYLPKAMNWIINHAPIKVIPVISGLVVVVQYVAKYQFRLSLIFSGISLIAGRYRPYVGRIRRVVLFPTTLSSFLFRSPLIIFLKVFGFSVGLQQEIFEKAKLGSERQRLEALIEKTPDAYQLWMFLMLNPEHLYTKQVRTT